LFFGIEFGQNEFALIFLGQLFQQGFQRLAGFTPGRPDIDENRHTLGVFQDALFEILLGNVK
jgi:hypothetical protein